MKFSLLPLAAVIEPVPPKSGQGSDLLPTPLPRSLLRPSVPEILLLPRIRAGPAAAAVMSAVSPVIRTTAFPA